MDSTKQCRVQQCLCLEIGVQNNETFFSTIGVVKLLVKKGGTFKLRLVEFYNSLRMAPISGSALGFWLDRDCPFTQVGTKRASNLSSFLALQQFSFSFLEC